MPDRLSIFNRAPFDLSLNLVERGNTLYGLRAHRTQVVFDQFIKLSTCVRETSCADTALLLQDLVVHPVSSATGGTSMRTATNCWGSDSRIADDDELGSFVFRTTGFNSIRTLSSRLSYFQAVSGGLLTTLPLELRLRGKSTTQSHRAPSAAEFSWRAPCF